MANAFHLKRRPSVVREVKRTGAMGNYREKPGFPSASLPGKSQPTDRSNGVKRAKIDPKRLGL